ncbi:hypothetical protein Leryth_013576 [Lithospermum erythrorhizon]|nr:hypothetical protein Leryth_013576 [Lithospermum erythrorhizon]
MFDDIDLANSSLHSHLHYPVSEPLSWKQRLMICIDVARPYGTENTILEFKISGILLDESIATKIDMFSAASEISTKNGVLDSDYIRDEETRDKAAVFSFGIILLEVLCPDNWFERNPVTVSIAKQIMPSINNYIPHVDPYIVGNISPESFKIYLQITLWCLHYLVLEMALQLQEATEDNHDIPEASDFTEIMIPEFLKSTKLKGRKKKSKRPVKCN